MHRFRVRRIRRHHLRALKAILPRNQGGVATCAPRKRRDAAPRSRY
jgi:hypothetical protein